MDFTELQKECWQIAEDHGFHSSNKVEKTFGDYCSLLTSEVSEAYEAYRKDGKLRITGYTEVDGKPEGVWAELADVVIRVFDTAQEHIGTAFEKILIQKMEYNRRRPFLHGKVL